MVTLPAVAGRDVSQIPSELVIPGLPFVIVYRVVGDAIEITRILHGAQKWP